MADQTEETTKPPRPAPRPRRFGAGTVLSLAVAGLVFLYGVLALSGRSLPVPEAVRASVEAAVNARFASNPVTLGSIRVGVGRDGIPSVLLDDIRFADAGGGAVAELNRLSAALVPGRLLRGEVAASNLYLQGAQVTVRRTADGSFALSSAQMGAGQAASVAEILARLDRVMASGGFAELDEIAAGGVVITLEDARSGRIWQATNAGARLGRTAEGLTVSVASDVFNGTDDIAGLQLSLAYSRATGRVSVGANVTGMPAADIALQSPVLSWLGVLDAPISGAVRAEVAETGALATFAGTLDIAGGALNPSGSAAPVAFRSAKAYFTFDPGRQRIDFSEIDVAADEGRLLASGSSYLTEFRNGWPGAFVGQFGVERFGYSGGTEFEGAVTLRNIRADLRIRLDPFTVELGQLAVDNEGVPLFARGRVAAGAEGWTASLDVRTEQLSVARLLTFWPLRLSPLTRGWLSRNLRAGQILRPAAGVRFRTGQPPEMSLSFGFDEGVTRFLPEMPLLTGARGRATIEDNRFTLNLVEGGVTAATGGRVDAAGSVFSVPDVRRMPSTGEIEIAARGPLTAALSILNNPPLRIMERAERPVDLAEAEAEVRAVVRLPLKDRIETEEVDYRVLASLTGVVSDSLVSGRVLAAPRLELRADPQEIGLDGDATLDGVPLTASWRQPLGPGPGHITGTVAISPETIAAFDLPLPDGMIAGSGTGTYELDLPRRGSPHLRLGSDLRGVTLAVPSIGWRKPAAEAGDLQLSARLGEVPDVESLELSAPGLALDGRLEIGAGGEFLAADFHQVRVGDWLDASVRLTPTAGPSPAVALTGGRFDLRRFDVEGESGDGGPITLQLDTMIVSDSVALSPLVGRFEQVGGGLSGDFEGRVNGQTPVQGTLAPANGGTAVRIRADDAAGVLRDAGLTPNARGGSLDIVLTPVPGAPGGTYDGQFLIEDVRLRKAPVMAKLLDAISVVGLIDQLDGPGIRFDAVDGQFRLNAERLTLRQAAAVGGSMGISADGIYDFTRKQMDFRGVVSPVYFVNGIGSVLTRRGEGLFGFNYRVTGTTDEPKVGTNPLSIFTPGIFRQIFRRPPPRG